MRPQLATDILRVPSTGYFECVHTDKLPWSEASDRVIKANWRRTIRRQLVESSPVSVMEIALMAGFLYYKLQPELQAPFDAFDVDFLFVREALAVEVDGRAWHDPDRDRMRDEILARKHCLTVHHVAAREVFYDPLRCVRDIIPLLEQAA